MLYTLGKTYYSVGLNSKCNRVIVAVKLMEIQSPDSNGFDCVTRSGGCNGLDTLASLYEKKADIKL